MRFVCGDVRDHIVSPKIEHGPSYWRYRASQRHGSLEISLLRDFPRRSIFDFCNNSAPAMSLHLHLNLRVRSANLFGALVKTQLQIGSDRSDRPSHLPGHVRFVACGDMRDHILSYQNDHRPSYWRRRALRQQARLRIDFSEILGVVRFSTFATISARNGHAEVSWRCPLLGEQRKTFALIELFRF
jgi:hypothetical protein